MAEAAFTPLAMTGSSYVWRSDYEERKAFGHGPIGKVAGRNRIPDARAPSSLGTTGSDYARLLIALVRSEGLTPAIPAQAAAPQVWVEEGCVVCIGKPRNTLSTSIAWGSASPWRKHPQERSCGISAITAPCRATPQ